MTTRFIIVILLFMLGTSVGSFLSVLISRHKNQKKGIIKGRSECPCCGTTLKTIDLIPIFSFILLKGKCRHCKTDISRFYFYIELLTGFIFALWAILVPFYEKPDLFTIAYFVFHLLIFTILIGIFFYDLLYREIPDVFTVPGIILSTLMIFLTPANIEKTPTWESASIAIAIIILFFGGQILMSRGRWLGIGDLILGIFMAVLLGWKLLLLSLGLAYVIGATVAITLLVTKKANRKSQIPFGPFLVVGTFISLLQGEYLINWYLSLLA